MAKYTYIYDNTFLMEGSIVFTEEKRNAFLAPYVRVI